MKNPIRKKDGTFKYPYQAVMPFVKFLELKMRLKEHPAIDYIHDDKKSYGTYLWGSTKMNVKGIVELFSLIREYIPDFGADEEMVHKVGYYRGNLYSIHVYIAYAEFDRDV